MNTLPILMYHSIDDTGSVISISPAEFERHLQFLSAQDYQGISLSEGAKLFQNKAPTARKIVLTFDDGFSNFFDRAFPLLQKHGYSATVFLVSNYCGKQNDWPGQGSNAPILSLLSWDKARELAANGIELGAHSCTHPKFTGLSEASLRREVLESRDVIQEKTGATVTSFAYPYGIVTHAAKQIVSENFQCAVGTELALANNEEDRFCLSRIDVYYLRSRFELLTRSSLTGYLKTRKIFRNLRKSITS